MVQQQTGKSEQADKEEQVKSQVDVELFVPAFPGRVGGG
jgi:hypothetical protein